MQIYKQVQRKLTYQNALKIMFSLHTSYLLQTNIPERTVCLYVQNKRWESMVRGIEIRLWTPRYDFQLCYSHNTLSCRFFLICSIQRNGYVLRVQVCVFPATYHLYFQILKTVKYWKLKGKFLYTWSWSSALDDWTWERYRSMDFLPLSWNGYHQNCC